MYQHRIRIKNRLLQMFYRPRRKQGRILNARTMSVLDELDRHIEEEITPLLSGLFKN